MRSPLLARMASVMFVLTVGLAMNGCSTYMKCERLEEEVVIPEGEDSAGFMDRVSEIEIMNMGTALYGLCLLVDEDHSCVDFQSRVNALTERGVISSRWDPSIRQPLTKGKLAYMIYNACGVKEKGVMLTLFGPSQRYCLRELQYHGMMAKGNESMPVTGLEFVAVLTRADAYKRTGAFPNEVGQPQS